MKDVHIIGGGLAGLLNAILLARQGFSVVLSEKKSYPFHRVCGEYISNEVRPFLSAQGLFPDHLQPSNINRFLLTSVNGAQAEMPLDLGAFGVSRYALDAFWVEKAREAGVEVRERDEIAFCQFNGERFALQNRRGEQFSARYVIGAFGKRSLMDRQMQRAFMQKRSPYIGVKYHIRLDFPSDLIALHNFPGGYCGLSKIEDGRYNLCYLGERKALLAHKDIASMEEAVLWTNPFLKEIYHEAEFLLDKPEVINEISFAPKEAVEGHILMSGDAAGLITPLCGNGMAMAIHSAKILSEILVQYGFQRGQVEYAYRKAWNKLFKGRLWAGRNIQRLFGGIQMSNAAVWTANHVPPVARFLMKQTHGEVF
ncbi:MAG: NAD(P)/FAD-dependent oxidoreductase [Bacteroidota bacterium]